MKKTVRSFILALVVVSLGDAQQAAGQFGGGGGPRSFQPHSRNVVLEGERISEQTIAIVATSVTQNLHASADLQAPASVNMSPALGMVGGGGFGGGGFGGGGAEPPPAAFVSTADSELAIRALHVNVRRPEDGSELDEAQMNQIWEEARRQLEEGLRRLQATNREISLKQRERGLQASRERVDAYRQQYDRDVAQLAEMTDNLDGGSQQEMESQLSATLAELRQLRVRMVGLEARRLAIEQRIDELRKQASEAAVDDPVTAELRKIVDIREQRLVRLQSLSESGTSGVTTADVLEGEAQLADARINLLTAEQKATTRAEGEVLRELNNELSMLIVQAAEFEATIKTTNEIADDLRAKASADRWSQIDLLRGHVERAKRRLIEAEQALDAQEHVTVWPPNEISIRPLDEVLAPEAAAP